MKLQIHYSKYEKRGWTKLVNSRAGRLMLATKNDFNINYTGGPPLTQKSLTRFPLPRFLAYVRVSGGIQGVH